MPGGAERKRRWIAEEVLQERSERACQFYGTPLENVTALKYMERVITVGDDEWPEETCNLQKARNSLGWILSREGAYPKVSGHFFKAVVQAVLMFGAET